ncbi:MAG: hypothetical protein Q3995_05855 [Eubacteriales bacterium]|nr:hypothetical protein [Eubacteriales bacterium]
MSIQVESGDTLLLGYQGESKTEQFHFDVSQFFADFGTGGSFLLLVKRHEDTAPYGVVTTVSGNTLIWSPDSTDTAKTGYGKCELQYYIGDKIAKSELWTTFVTPALDAGDATPPAPWASWVDDVMGAAEQIHADLSGKAEQETVLLTEETSVTLSAGCTTVISGAPVSVQVTLPTPSEGLDFLCGLIFRAGDGLAFSDTAPEGYAIKWEDEPTWAEHTIYEIIYRCLWIADSNSKIIISAKYAEVSE